LKGRGTALHVAINNGHKYCVKLLVDAIVKHDDQSGLELSNEKGATPLHLAAHRGFISMCEYIIGENGERKNLIQVKNSNGETPIFWAVLARQREAFVYLNKIILSNDTDEFVPYDSYDMEFAINNDGTTILHVAIEREIFG
jgi:ankyrin repeat protein